jgi:hypothetical protein
MSDASDLTMVAGSALPAAFTFLFNQLDSILVRRRARRDVQAADVPAELTAEDVPRELVGTVSLPLQTDEARLEVRAAELDAYLRVLRVYMQDSSRITNTDEGLMAVLGQVRSALEEIYGQRFTFTGEQRPRSGPSVVGRYKEVAGDLIGMEASEAIRGNPSVEHDVGTIRPGGKVIGMSAPYIEGDA